MREHFAVWTMKSGLRPFQCKATLVQEDCEPWFSDHSVVGSSPCSPRRYGPCKPARKGPWTWKTWEPGNLDYAGQSTVMLDRLISLKQDPPPGIQNSIAIGSKANNPCQCNLNARDVRAALCNAAAPDNIPLPWTRDRCASNVG